MRDATPTAIDARPSLSIHLVRRNVFERAISVYINGKVLRGLSARGSLRRDSKVDYGQKIYVKPGSLKRIIKETKTNVEFWLDKIREEGPNCLTLDYEELFDEKSLTRTWEAGEPDVLMPKPVAKKICDFLDVEYRELRSPTKRMNTPDYETYIENWSDIRGLREIIEL